MRRLTAIALGLFAGTTLLACVVGQGQGAIAGTTNIPLCQVVGPYDLHPSFYAASRLGNLLTVRIQNGGGPADYTDNLEFEIDDTEEVTRRIAASSERDADGNPVVTLAVGPAGSPDVLVHAIFSPTHSCGRTKVTRLGQVVALWAYTGTITFRSVDRGASPTGVTTQSYHRVTDVSDFHVRLHDPRPIGMPAPSNVSPTDPVGDAELSGWFRFEFDRSAPAQPFGPSSP